MHVKFNSETKIRMEIDKFVQMLAFDVVFHFWCWKAIEWTGNRYGIGAHVLENYIVAKAQLWQLDAFRNLRPAREKNK